MTFISAFYNFSIELNHADRGIFTSFRTKVPRHELESSEHFFASILAYCHAYTPELKFSNASSPDVPSMWAHDPVGNVLTWIQVGVPKKRLLELSLKQNPDTQHLVYFYREEDIAKFCHYLRGSTSNWIKQVTFYQLSLGVLEQLGAIEDTSPRWNISFIDNTIYLTINSLDIESELTPINMWDAFQISLLSSHGAEQ